MAFHIAVSRLIASLRCCDEYENTFVWNKKSSFKSVKCYAAEIDIIQKEKHETRN